MSKSRSEVGHSKNVANFTALIQLLGEMGPLYNPTNPEIKITNLEDLRDQLIAAIQNLSDKTPPFKLTVANRENAFSPLSKLSTRVKNSFNSLRLSKADKDNVLALVKKIRGDQPATKAKDLEKEENDTISNAQLSYTSKAGNLQSLISLLSAYPTYAPNETDLKVSSLSSLYTQLKTFNNEAADKTFALITARKQRNDLLYFDPICLILLVNPIKDYIKSVEGANTYYKQAVRLKFTNIKP